MFKFILWLVFIYLIYYFVKGLLTPPASSRKQNRTAYTQQQEQRREGETYVHQKPQNQQSSATSGKNTDGDYIDYEEVK